MVLWTIVWMAGIKADCYQKSSIVLRFTSKWSIIWLFKYQVSFEYLIPIIRGNEWILNHFHGSENFHTIFQLEKENCDFLNSWTLPCLVSMLKIVYLGSTYVVIHNDPNMQSILKKENVVCTFVLFWNFEIVLQFIRDRKILRPI